MRKNIKGELNLPERNLNELQLILVRKTESDITSFNLSDFLKKVQGKEVGIAIEYAGMDLFCEVGKVYICNGLTLINDVCLEHRLWDYVGQELKIIIDDLEEES